MKFRKLLPVALVCFAFLPQMQAAPVPNPLGTPLPGYPSPDGCYAAFTTAEGCNALALLGAGIGNTALGWYSLFLVGGGSFNTGTGAGALAVNTASENTATGAGALLLNTTGRRNTAAGINVMLNNDSGLYNGAFGSFALFNNTNGFSNNAMGDSALLSNVHGAENTAVGDLALANNDFGASGLANFNTAVGAEALLNNTLGDSNNAVGAFALSGNTIGVFNQAMGVLALSSNLVGSANIAIGDSAAVNLGTAGPSSFNTVIGDAAGGALTSGSDNIYIGATSGGPAVESGTIRIGDPLFVGACFIAGIASSPPNDGANVHVDAAGRLTPSVSSARYKKDIKPMDKASESLLALKPVTFSYKNDAKAIQHYGLVAEEVAKVNPDLVVVDDGGKPWSVRYDEVNAMLLNEFIKEHRILEKQQATMASQEAQIKWLTETVKQQATQIQKVSAQLEMIRPTPQVVENH